MRRCWLVFLLFCCASSAYAVDARFDLVGPRIDIRVTRRVGDTQQTLPIASVPNLQPGDKLWIHPDLPATQSVKYLLICAFLRGTTNPPPDSWFYRVETWKKEVREEGFFVSVPAEAQQVVLFMAPETGGDFTTLKSAVRGRPGVFVRASQDLNEAGFEQARIERYLVDIRRVPPSDPGELQRRSDLLARTLALKPNAECFKRPVDVQFTCLTQTGSQTLLDDGHGQNIASALSNGPTSDLIQATSYTAIAGAGLYSAYVGAIVDLVRLMGNLHTAQYQYIPAIAFPQGEALNLRLNTPPSFHNPKSVLVIGLPSVQEAQKPPLRPANANDTVCLLKPKVVLPIEGAPLVFSTDFATGLVLHLNTPPGAPAEPDIRLTADAFEGGLVLDHGPQGHQPMRQMPDAPAGPGTAQKIADAGPANGSTPRTQPVLLTGTIQGHWGFDSFTGPTVPLQQLPGGDWQILHPDGTSREIIAGRTAQLFLTSTGGACVHTVSVEPANSPEQISVPFQQDPLPDHANLIALTLPDTHRISPGDLRVSIQQYGQPLPNLVAAQTFSDPPRLEGISLPASDKAMLVNGTHLDSVEKITLGDLTFRPTPSTWPGTGDGADAVHDSLRLTLPPDAATPPTHAGEKLSAQVVLKDGRQLPFSLVVGPARPAVALIERSFDSPSESNIGLSSPDDLPLSAHLTFTLKSRTDFPRNGRVQIETSDGTLRSVLTLVPSGGLILQDPHTVVASLDPLRAFGPSAFGSLRMRAVFPQPSTRAKSASNDGDTGEASTSSSADGGVDDPSRESDWMPLGTLVRLPALARLQCTSDAALPCTLTGSNLYLVQGISADPTFENASEVPDGFTGNSLSVPHPAGSSGVLFLKLRDDPEQINTATLPSSTVTAEASTAHASRAGSAAHN